MPELNGETRVRLDIPPVYTPEEIPILSTHELPDVRTVISSNNDQLQGIKSRLQKSQKILHMDTLLHLRNALKSTKHYFTHERDNYNNPMNLNDASNPVHFREDKK
jgi:hypothetical protein